MDENMLIKALQQAVVSESQLVPSVQKRNELQRTKDWYIDRLGMITGTDADTILSGLSTKKISDFVLEKIAEKLYDTSNELFMQQMNAMSWGNMFESEAIENYEKLMNVRIKSAKFFKNKKVKGSGSSVDGYVGKHGLIEIKCPYNSGNHVSVMLGNDIDTKYYNQIQKQLYDTGRQWCDFVSFDPRMKQKYKLVVRRIYPDEELHRKFESQIEKIVNEIETQLKKIK